MRSVLSESGFEEFQRSGYVRPGIVLPDSVLSKIRSTLEAVPIAASNYLCFYAYQLLDRDPGWQPALRRLLARLPRRPLRWLLPRLLRRLAPPETREFYRKAVYPSDNLLVPLVLGECLHRGLGNHLGEAPLLVAHDLYLESNPDYRTFESIGAHQDGFAWDIFYQTGDDLSLYIPLQDLNETTGGRLLADSKATESGLYPIRNTRISEFAEFCRAQGVAPGGELMTREAIQKSPARESIGVEYHLMERRQHLHEPPARGQLTPIDAKAGEVFMFNNKLYHDVEPWRAPGSRAIYIVRLSPTYDFGLAPPTRFLNDVPCNQHLLDGARGTLQAIDCARELPPFIPVPED